MIRFSSAEKYFLDFLRKKKECEATWPVNKRFKRIEGPLKNRAEVLIQYLPDRVHPNVQ